MNDVLCSLVTIAIDAIRTGKADSAESVAAHLAELGIHLDEESANVVYGHASKTHIEKSIPEEVKHQKAKDALADTVGDLTKTTAGEFARELVRAGFLASLRPMQASIIGNAGAFALESLAKAPAELVDMMVAMKTSQRSVARSDVKRTLSRMKSIPKEALAAMDEFKESLRHIGSAPTQSGYADKGATIDYRPFKEGSALNAPFKGASYYINKVYGLIEMADAPARAQAFRAALWEHALLDGMNNGINPRDKAALTAHALEIVGNGDPVAITSAFLKSSEGDPLKKVYLDSKKTEDEAVFANRSIGTDIAGQVSRLPVAGVLFLPFPRIPTNVVARALEWSPLGFVYGAGKAFQAVSVSKAGHDPRSVQRVQRQGALAIGRAMTSTGMFALGYYLKQLQPDYVTEPTPSDYDDAESMRAKGRQGSSILVGGEQFSLRDVPQLVPFFAGALLAESVNVEGKDGASVTDYVQSSGRGLARTAMDAPVLQGVSAAQRFLDQSERGRPIEETSIAKQVGGAVVPAVVSDIMSDGTRRVVRSPFDRLMADFGGKSLPKQVDAFGEEISYNTGIAGQVRGMSSGARARMQNKLRAEADKLGITLDIVKQKSGESGKAYEARARRAGELFKESAQWLMDSDWYKTASKADKIEQWKKIKSQAREIASKESSLKGD